MNKLRILARKCAALPTLLHFLVHLKCNTLGRKCSSSAALFSSLIRRISQLKPAIYSVSKCSSVGSSPNFAQENDVSRGAYLTDEYDSDDFERWEAALEDMWNDVGWPEWAVEAVDEAIAEEKPGEYPPLGDIPF